MFRPSRALTAAGSMANVLIATIGSKLFGTDKTLALAKDPLGSRGHRRDRSTLFNRVNQEIHLTERRKRMTPQLTAYQAAVNALTNYERTQWARAGYPGGQHEDGKKVAAFRGIRSRNMLRTFRDDGRPYGQQHAAEFIDEAALIADSEARDPALADAIGGAKP